MPRPCFYYLQGFVGKSELLSQHGVAINRILRGDYTSANFEKLTGHDVYSLRLGSAERLLFTTIEISGVPSLLVLDYLPNHEYSRSKFLKSGVLKKYRERLYAESGTLTFTDISEDSNPLNVVEVPRSGDLYASGLQYYHDQWVSLSPKQEEVYNLHLPGIINGVAGSGKSLLSLVLMSKYGHECESYGEKQRILYVCHSKKLIEVMRNEWLDTWSNLFADKIEAVFKSYEEIVLEDSGYPMGSLILQDNLPEATDESTGKCGILRSRKDVFIDWFREYDTKQALIKKSQKKDKAKAQETIKPDLTSEELYEEFRIRSGYLSLEEYIDLGKKQTTLSIEERRWVCNAYDSYNMHLSFIGQVDLSLYCCASNEMYDLIVVDEAQDLSRRALCNLLGLSKMRRILFAMDTHQQLYDSRSVLQYLFRLLRINEQSSNYLFLSSGHRCPILVSDAANIVLTCKHQVSQGISDKNAILGVESIYTGNTRGQVYIYNASNDASQDPEWFTKPKGSNFVVVTLPEYIREASARFNTILVMTPEEIKGLEYEIVVTYRLYPVSEFKEITNNHSVNMAREVINRAKCGQEITKYNTTFNRIYMAYMRSTSVLFIIEEYKKRNAFLIERLSGDIANPTIPADDREYAYKNTKEDWGKEVRRQLDKGNNNLAESIYTKYLGTTEEFHIYIHGYEESLSKISFDPSSEEIVSIANNTEKAEIENALVKVTKEDKIKGKRAHKSKNKIQKSPIQKQTIQLDMRSIDEKVTYDFLRLFKLKFNDESLDTLIECVGIHNFFSLNPSSAHRECINYIFGNEEYTRMFFKRLVNNVCFFESNKPEYWDPQITLNNVARDYLLKNYIDFVDIFESQSKLENLKWHQLSEFSPVYYVLTVWDIEKFQVLIDLGAKCDLIFTKIVDTPTIFKRYIQQKTLLHHAFESAGGRFLLYSIILKLIESGANAAVVSSDGKSALHALFTNIRASNLLTDLQKQDIQLIITLLIDNGCAINLLDNNNKAAMHYFPYDIPEIWLTVTRNGMDLNVLNSSEARLIAYLVKNNCFLTIEALDAHVPNFKNTVIKIGDYVCTPLSYALYLGNYECALSLIQLGANLTEKYVFFEKNGLMDERSCPLISLVLKKFSSARDVSIIFEILRQLRNRGVDFTVKNHKNQTAVHIILGNDEITQDKVIYVNEVIKMLLEYGCSPNDQDSDGKATMTYLQWDMPEILITMFENGAIFGDTAAIYYYIQKKFLFTLSQLNKCVPGLINSSFMNTEKIKKFTPIHCAILSADPDVIDFCLSEGCCINKLCLVERTFVQSVYESISVREANNVSLSIISKILAKNDSENGWICVTLSEFTDIMLKGDICNVIKQKLDAAATARSMSGLSAASTYTDDYQHCLSSRTCVI